MEKTKLPKRLREALLEKNFTHSTFAQKIGFSQTTVTRWCNGKQEPDCDTLLLIARTLNESLDYLLGLKDD
jgi:transcriptional regulator with XRE-family HTH domain